MFAGYMSIVFAVNHLDFILSSWMIVLAAFLDAIDGKVARITNSASKFGVEYDSLADVVSFGVAPSVLIYQFYLKEVEHVGLFISFFPLVFGSIRLARFNVQLTGYTKTHFSGLPIPAAAITIASYILLIQKYFEPDIFPRILMVIVLVVSLLMISNVRYEVFPQLTFRGSRNQKIIFLGLIIGGVAVLLLPHALLFPVMLLYIAAGFFKELFMKTSAGTKKIRERRKQRKIEKLENKNTNI